MYFVLNIFTFFINSEIQLMIVMECYSTLCRILQFMEFNADISHWVFWLNYWNKVYCGGGADLEKVIILNSIDNIGVALDNIKKGELVEITIGEDLNSFNALEDIPFGFKIAIVPIYKEQYIIKYGEVIGIASKNILIGELAHIHNVEGIRGRGDLYD